MKADDPFDQTKSAASTWMRSQAGKLGPFLNDPYTVVPLNIPSQALIHQTAIVKTSLRSFALKTSPGRHVQILADGRYVLYGDLFKTGETYALVELPITSEIDPGWNNGRLAFAQLEKGEWELRGLWDIATVWRPQSWKKSPDDYLPVQPAEAPFMLKDFDGDDIPEVIMAGEVWRYYQNYYLLRFDARTHSLQMLAAAMGKPELHEGYVRFYYNSGHRAIFEEWVFAKLMDGKLEKIATWHNGVPYNQGDDEGLRVEALNPRGELELFKIDDITADATHECYQINCDGAKRATVLFSRKPLRPSNPQVDFNSLEEAWLFHHMTGLADDLFPEKRTTALSSFSKYESVSITGDADFIQQMNHRKD